MLLTRAFLEAAFIFYIMRFRHQKVLDPLKTMFNPPYTRAVVWLVIPIHALGTAAMWHFPDPPILSTDHLYWEDNNGSTAPNTVF